MTKKGIFNVHKREMEIVFLTVGGLVGATVAGLWFRLQQANRWVSKVAFLEIEKELVEVRSQYSALQKLHEYDRLQLSKLGDQIEQKTEDVKMVLSENGHLKAKLDAMEEKFITQKSEVEKLHQQNLYQFQTLAGKIMEENSAKLTATNHKELRQILMPFQEKIVALNQRVNEAYDKESKERFSLGEKVKELAALNQQISEEANRLTRALKGENKTQGRWGEMILESILEKSGLTKGQEYFLEYQLEDEHNKALRSEFSGKKMRPDAVVVYPDKRSVIIDAKVSLTDFTALVDEENPEVAQLKARQHLQSVKRHIDELSKKAYDDFASSLDFVMMFMPSEAAYISAVQQDPNLWDYAYEKRIILLNPANLITSLKLISDLWKREKQNQNVLEIASRGTKLYHKFVDFVNSLGKVGAQLQQTHKTYEEAYARLTTGNDNLIRQAQKLRDLGVKSKKELPSNLLDDAQVDGDAREEL